MKYVTKRVGAALYSLGPLALLAGFGCQPMSERVEAPSLGPNGGFEHVRSGLPVNWLVYSPKTIPSGRYELVLDREDFREGAQSLRFDVEECASSGGWRSPGIAQELPVEPGTTYAVSFWIKSEGCRWTVSYGGVSAKAGRIERVASSPVEPGAWRHVELAYAQPPDYERLRFELCVTSPGRLWIDDVRIEPRGGEGGAAPAR